MHVNFYKKPQIKTHKTPIKVEKSILFLDYLEHFISNSATKRVQGYGTVGLAHNTIRTYKSLFRMEGPSFFAGPLLDFFPAFFAEFGSKGMSIKISF
jgi:hypothetical protein